MRRALLALGSFLLPLLLLEGLLRMTGAGGPAEHPPAFDRRSVFYRPHPSRLHPHTAGGEAGLKVALIGDSFTFGSANDWDDAFGRRLERLLNLNAETPPAEVRIWAEKGSATVHQVKYLHRAMRYEPDLLILAIFLNDTEDSADPWLKQSRELRRPRTPEGWSRAVLRGSRALAWLYQRYENRRARHAQRDYLERIYDPEYSGWKGFTRALGVFADTARDAQVPFVALLFPGMGQLDPGAHGFAHERLRAALADLNVPTLDLLDSFAGKDPGRMSAYPRIDTHPSEIGHRIAAHALFDFLLDGGFVDPAYRPELRDVHRTDEDWLQRLRRMESAVWAEP